MFEFILLFGIVVAFLLWNGYRRARDVHRLTTLGLPVTGTITARKTRAGRHTRSRHIEYTWTLGGQTYKGRSFLSSDEYAALKEGEPIELIYLPGQARIAAPVFVVEASRRAAA